MTSFKNAFALLQKIGKCMMLPVSVLPVAGILLGVGSANFSWLPESVSLVMAKSGDAIFGNLPLLFAIGVALTPWDKLVAAFHPANLVTIVATVTTLMTTGWIVGRMVNLYPIDAAVVNACHSGQGGTGDVAILTAANRMQLMPFAQIATRIGGAITVTLTLLALRALT